MEQTTVKLKLESWLLEQEKQVQATLSLLRNLLGAYRAETDKTYNFLEGYLAAMRSAIRRDEL